MPRTRYTTNRVLGSYIREAFDFINIDVLVLSIIVSLSIYFAFSIHDQVTAMKVTCPSLVTRANAQKVFKSNPTLYKGLDRNHDGIACNDLP